MDYRPLGTFRLFLALLVVFQHYVQWVFPGAVQRAVMPFEPGSTAVYVFFCLSGLVIAEAADRVYRGRTIAFAANRFLRIVPLYVATIAATVAAIVMIVPDTNVLAARNLVANLLLIVPLPGRMAIEPDMKLIRIAWALRFEAAFYIAIAAVLLAGANFRRALVWTSAAILTLAIVDHVTGRTWTPFVAAAAFFIAGACYYLAISGDRLAAFVAAAAFALSIVKMGALAPLFIILCGCCAALAVLSISSRLRRVDQLCGDLSYPVYLGHWLPLFVFVESGAAADASAGVRASVLFLGLLCPLLLYLAVEPTVTRMRDLIRGRNLRAYPAEIGSGT